LGLDEDQGVVRIGLAHYNTEAEVDGTLRALARALQ
jgi:selenocysteine lyase/cysteine desulfurase